LVAFYSHDDGTNLFFRCDFFELGFNVENFDLDVYVAIDCVAGGVDWLPNFTDVKWDHLWDVCVVVSNTGSGQVINSSYVNQPAEFLGSYWRSDLDGVEFGIKRSYLTGLGWNGTAPLHFAAFTVRDGAAGNIRTNGSNVVDAFGATEGGSSTSNGWLFGSIASTATTGRAKYAAIAHANQSVAPRGGTQGHIFTDRSDLTPDLFPGFVRLIDSAEMLDAPVNLHISGTLLMSFLWATQNPAEPGLQGYPNRDGPTFLGRVKRFVTPGQGPGSLIGGVLAEHIMQYFEGDVNRKSIGQNNELIQQLFGLTAGDMKVMHVPERVIHSNTNSPHVSPAGPIKGKPFEDITAGGFQATYLDEVTHLHWWFYPNETNNAGWDDFNCGRWAGGRGNDEEKVHHKAHKINGVTCFMINDREDQSKFGPDDNGLQMDTRYTLLRKAMDPDYAQLTLVFDDWEAYAGNSFASGSPNNNADQWDRTVRWIANHPWIEMVNLRDVATWAAADTNWVVDHGTNNFDKTSQTYEWLKRASEHDYDHWYYGKATAPTEESFFSRTARVHDAWAPAGMKKYGDLNTTNTLIRDSWDRIQQIAATNLKKLAEWSYSAMIYETAWHDEDANPDQYKSRNYQVTFNRTTAQGNCDDSYEDTTTDVTSGWALRLHGHVRDMGVMKAASDWVQNIKSGAQGPDVTSYALDIDDDTLAEYVLCNNKVFLCFERWGARLIKAFAYDPLLNGGDAHEVIGAPLANPAEESENEGFNNNRCSAMKDHWSTGLTNSTYVDLDFALAAPVQGTSSWRFVSADTNVTKTYTLERGRDVLRAEYGLRPAVGTLYVRHGLGPNPMDLVAHGHSNLVEISDASFRGLKNLSGGEAYVVAGRNCAFTTLPADTDWDGRRLPMIEQYETFNTATNFSLALAFSESAARDLDGDGLSNTNETALGTDYERADTDGDGMPDGYEIGNGLVATNQNDAGGDLDGDGMCNVDEYVANTSANDTGSFLRVVNVVRPSASVEIAHPVSAPRHYQVLYANGDLMNAAWQPFANTSPPVGSFLNTNLAVTSHTFTDDFTAATTGGAPTNGQRSYTIRVSIP
jgi:hypothetical protein